MEQSMSFLEIKSLVLVWIDQLQGRLNKHQFTFSVGLI
jgi:hypothetical protein